MEHVFEVDQTTDSFILDSEIVAIDPNDGRLKSFQELSNRARKDVKLEDVKVAVCVYAFDIMYLDGEVRFRTTSIASQLTRRRFYFKKTSANAERYCGQGFRHIFLSEKMPQGSITSRAVKVKMAAIMLRNSGRPLSRVPARGS